MTLRYGVFITEDGAGFWNGKLVLAGPGGRYVSARFGVQDTGGWAPQCGEGNDVYDPTFVTCGISVRLRKDRQSGTWTVKRLELTDNVGNARRLKDIPSTPIRVSRNDVLSASNFALTSAVLDTWRAPKTRPGVQARRRGRRTEVGDTGAQRLLAAFDYPDDAP